MIEIDNKTRMLEQIIHDFTMEIIGKINEIGNIFLILEEEAIYIDLNANYVKEFQHKIYAWQRVFFEKYNKKEEENQWKKIR